LILSFTPTFETAILSWSPTCAVETRAGNEKADHENETGCQAKNKPPRPGGPCAA